METVRIVFGEPSGVNAERDGFMMHTLRERSPKVERKRGNGTVMSFGGKSSSE